MATSRGSLGALEDSLSNALKGLKSELAPTSTLDIDGATYTVKDLVHELEHQLSVFAADRSARIEAKVKLDARREVQPKSRALLKGLRATLATKYGETNPELEKFGMRPRKAPQPLTAEELVAKAEAARRTREARHTLGRRQREAIRGTDLPAEPASPPAAAPTFAVTVETGTRQSPADGKASQDGAARAAS